MWLAGHKDGKRADLRNADLRNANLRGANLWGADLRNADLWGATGNMREIKSAQFDTWGVCWTTSPEGIVTLQIGCQSHPLQEWADAEPCWIDDMDPDALVWWERYRDVVLALVEASPATPHGPRPT
jgi:hypothetical protein